MVRKPQLAHQPKSSKESRIGFEKMQLSHQRMRKDIKRILVERAKRTETGAFSCLGIIPTLFCVNRLHAWPARKCTPRSVLS